jgi:hypothetical protein
MGIVIQLDDFRTGRRPADSLSRLDAAVARLDPLVRNRGDRLPANLVRQLAAVARMAESGRAREAARRAERLADVLEHPALGASS